MKSLDCLFVRNDESKYSKLNFVEICRSEQTCLKYSIFFHFHAFYLNARAHTQHSTAQTEILFTFFACSRKNCDAMQTMCGKCMCEWAFTDKESSLNHRVNRFLIEVYVHSDKRKHVQLSGALRCQKSAIECNRMRVSLNECVRCIKQLTVQSNRQTFKLNPLGKLLEIKVN